MANYEITAISFVSRAYYADGSVEGNGRFSEDWTEFNHVDNAGIFGSDKGNQPYKRINRVYAQVTFSYIGFNACEEYGTVLVPISNSAFNSICEVSFNQEGKAESIDIKLKEADIDAAGFVAAINLMIKDAVEAEILNLQLVAQESATVKHIVSKLNDKIGYNKRYTEQPASYPELDDFNTGIGANKTNILEL